MYDSDSNSSNKLRLSNKHNLRYQIYIENRMSWFPKTAKKSWFSKKFYKEVRKIAIFSYFSSLGFEPGTSRLLLYIVNERFQVRIPLRATFFFVSKKLPIFPPVSHTILKVKFLSQNSILTKTLHFHEFYTQFIFDNFSPEIKAVNS